MFKRSHFKLEQHNPDGQAGGNAGAGDSGQAGKSMGNSSTGEANTNVNSGDSGNHSAQASGTQDQNTDGGDSEFNFDTLPKSAQDYIKSLRTESAEHRTKNNNLNTRLESIENGFKTMFGGEGEGQDFTPEQKLEQLQGGYEDLSYQNAVMGMAYENGISPENYEYFNFLMEKAVNGLEEGQELSEEALTEVIGKSKSFKQSTADDTNTSVDGEDDEGKDPEGNSELTLEAFAKMGISQKSELYRKSPEVYNSLMKQAKEQKLL